MRAFSAERAAGVPLSQCDSARKNPLPKGLPYSQSPLCGYGNRSAPSLYFFKNGTAESLLVNAFPLTRLSRLGECRYRTVCLSLQRESSQRKGINEKALCGAVLKEVKAWCRALAVSTQRAAWIYMPYPHIYAVCRIRTDIAQICRMPCPHSGLCGCGDPFGDGFSVAERPKVRYRRNPPTRVPHP